MTTEEATTRAREIVEKIISVNTYPDREEWIDYGTDLIATALLAASQVSPSAIAIEALEWYAGHGDSWAELEVFDFKKENGSVTSFDYEAFGKRAREALALLNTPEPRVETINASQWNDGRFHWISLNGKTYRIITEEEHSADLNTQDGGNTPQEAVDDAPQCQNYEFECEELGKLCESLGLDCSNCYDKKDLIQLIQGGFARLKEEQPAPIASDALKNIVYSKPSTINHEPVASEKLKRVIGKSVDAWAVYAVDSGVSPGLYGQRILESLKHGLMQKLSALLDSQDDKPQSGEEVYRGTHHTECHYNSCNGECWEKYK